MTVAPCVKRQSAVAPALVVNDHDGARPEPGDAGAAVMTGAVGTERSSAYTLLVVAPVLPAGSVARTAKVNAPSGWAVRSGVNGLVHAVHPETTPAGPSTRHWSEAPASAVKDQVGVASVPGLTGVPVSAGAAGGAVSKR